MLIRLFCKIVKLRFLALIEYPGAYLSGIVAQWISYGVEVFMIYILVAQFGALSGWLPAEITFLYAVWLLSYALGASYTFNLCQDFAQMAVNGLLDEALTRPVPPLFYLIATEYNLGYVSHVTLMLGVLTFSLSKLRPAWHPWQWLWLVGLILCAAVIQGCLMLLLEMPALRLKGKSPAGVFFWEGRRFAQYPISIYGRPLRILFTSLLPFGFVGYYPLQALLGKADDLFGYALTFVSPLVAVILVFLTGALWRRTVARYESAGT